MQKLKRLATASFLALIFFAASWALFVPKFFRVHDFTHAGRIVEMARALGDGQFPVRWSANFGFGYGMPLFEFYGPLPYYVGGLLYLLGMDAVTGIKILYLLANLITVGGAYRLGQKFYGRSGGLITAAALTLAPYRALNLFIRGALNEAWAIAFLPWILLAVVEIFQRERRAWLWLTLSLTGLLLTHNIMTMLFGPVLLLFGLLFVGSLLWRRVPELFRKREFRWFNFFRMIGPGIGSVLLALGLSAFYTVPAFLEKDLTQVESTVLTSYFDYHLHFLYIRQFFTPHWGYGGSGWGTEDGISFFLGWGQWLALGILAFLVCKGAWQWLRSRKAVFPSKRVGAVLVIAGVMLGAVLYMSLLKSQWLWDAVSPLKYAQFPWRWLGIAIVLVGLLAGGVTSFMTRRSARTGIAIALVLAILVGSAGYFQPEKYLDNSEEFYYTDASRIRTNLSGILPDYTPVGVSIPPHVIPQELIVNASELPTDSYEVLADRSAEKLIRTDFAEDTRVSFAVADYPGWRTEIDTQRWNRHTGIDGNIELIVPAGEHLVALRFQNTPIRMAADTVSLLSLIILVILALPRQPRWTVTRAKDA